MKGWLGLGACLLVMGCSDQDSGLLARIDDADTNARTAIAAANQAKRETDDLKGDLDEAQAEIEQLKSDLEDATSDLEEVKDRLRM